MAKLPSFDHSPEDNTVIVTHPGYSIQNYMEVRAGQLTALLAVLHAHKFHADDQDKETVQLLAEELAEEVSGLVEKFTRELAPEVRHG